MQPLRWITVGYITGILWGLYLKINIVPMIFLCFGGFFLCKKTKVNSRYHYFFLIFFLAMVISYFQIQFLEYRFGNLYQQLDNVDIVGVIISDAKKTTYKQVYILKVETVNGNKKYQNTYLNLYCGQDIKLDYGKKISFQGKYEPATKAKNYKAFDYANYLKTKNIYGNVIMEGKYETSQKRYLNPILLVSHDCKEKIQNHLDKMLGEEAKIAKRNFASEIFLKWKMR